MPNRVIRDWTDSERIDQLDVNAERFFTRLIMKVDDFGRYSANVKLLKSQLFPLKSDIRETDITRWLTACEKFGLIVLYNVAGKEYLQIEDFRQVLRQKKEKYPPPTACDSIAKHLLSNCLADASLKGNESESERKQNISPSGDAGAEAPTDNRLEFYRSKVEKTKRSIYDFIVTKPDFIEPYVDFWNLFAKEKKLPQVEKITDSRKRKFSIRVKDSGFDFPEILRKAGSSEFILSGTWFGFDWIMENDKNYLKVIEGSYDNKTGQLSQAVVPDKKLSDAVKKIESGEDTVQEQK